MSNLTHITFNSNGQQFRVQAGDTIVSNRIGRSVGDSVQLNNIVLAEYDDGKIAVGEAVKNINAQATVVSHLLGEKLRIFKMRRRKSSRRTQGHRQQLTKLHIEKINSN